MKRIVFMLNRQPGVVERLTFAFKMMLSGIAVSVETPKKLHMPDEHSLYITDDADTYEMLKELSTDAIVIVYEEGDMDKFKEAKYFLMDAFNTEAAYFERTYRRINKLPLEAISTKRLVLRETIEADVDEFSKIYDDPDMTRYTEGIYEDLEEERRYVREYREKVYSIQGFGIWTVVRKEDSRIIGRAGLTYREGFDNYEIGFLIGKEYQRRGYARECIEAIKDYSRREGLGELIALVMPENKPSIELLKETGFEKNSETALNGTHYQVWKTTGVASANFGML